jgi:NAD-dependent SIR2 family protein deacetylase
VPTKICTKCKIEKDFDEFSAEKRHTDGKLSRCKDCTREDGRNWHLMRIKQGESPFKD